MKSVATRYLSVRTVRILDRALALWIVFWIGVGWFAVAQVSSFTTISDTLVTTGSSMSQTGDALRLLAAVPLVGGQVSSVANTITKAGAQMQTDGRQSRNTVQQLSWVIGFALAVVPSLLMMAVYVPRRAVWRRDVLALRAGLARGDAGLEKYLAHRAIDTLPYDVLQTITDDPWRDLAAGKFGRLADAELARLGVARPALRL
jgi:hypothetical protein